MFPVIVHELFGALTLPTLRFKKSVHIELLYSCCVCWFSFVLVFFWGVGVVFVWVVWFLGVLFVCFKANGNVTLNDVVEGDAVMVNLHLNVLGIHC